MIAALLLSCAAPPTPPAEAPPLLDGPALARRVSLDLRGVPPSAEELIAAEADPAAWTAVRNAALDDPRLTERLVHLFAQTWHTRVDAFDVTAADYGLADADAYRWERAVGEEPLRILARVVTEDLPWSEVVTADWTMANEQLGATWPVAYPEGGTGWVVSEYLDGRPAAGVLSTNGLWWRYTTTPSNMNRGRAAALSRLLLCEDFLQRPVAFSEADTTASSTADAAQEDPYCLTCHASLDPVAASLFGFWWVSLYSEVEETSYHPERETLWLQYLGVEPAWYGTPIGGLPDLGPAVANDSRFTSCAVETMAEALWRRDATAADDLRLEALRAEFLRADTRMRPIMAALTETGEYRDPAPRLLTHDQLASSLEALTGFTWTWEGAALLDTDASGYRTLAGGVDGVTITAPQAEPGLTWALVVKRAAEAAAYHAVRTELEEGGTRTLFAQVTLDTRPGTSAFDAELDQLGRRVVGAAPDDATRDALTTLWTEVDAGEGPAAAWRALVSALLRDPSFLTY